MTYEFARQMEREAVRIAQQGGYTLGVKPFHSYAGLFEKITKKVFVGLAPGGREKSVQLDQHHRHLERVYEDPGHNSYLDEKWETRIGGEYPIGEAPLQRNLLRVFEEIYGGGAEQEIRKTPCFNVVPFRANVTRMNAGDLRQALEWARQLLDRLSQKLVICYSGSKTLRSTLSDLFSYIDAKFVIGKPTELQGQLLGVRDRRLELFE